MTPTQTRALIGLSLLLTLGLIWFAPTETPDAGSAPVQRNTPAPGAPADSRGPAGDGQVSALPARATAASAASSGKPAEHPARSGSEGRGVSAGGRVVDAPAPAPQAAASASTPTASGLNVRPSRPSLLGADAEGLFGRQSWFRPPPPPPPLPPGPPPPPPAPVAPPLPFGYLGKYIEGSTELLVLTRGNRVITAAKGDVLDNQYRIERIDPSAVQILYLPLNQPQTLPTGSSQ